MELMHSDRIFFDPTSHSYLLDDDQLLTGVTSLMRKHNLGGVDYSGIPAETLRKAAEEGTAIHEEIQAYERGETMLATELIDEYKKLNLKFVEAEYPVSDFESVASAIDLVCEGSAPDKVVLIDIKTTQKYHRRYLEWQLGIYRSLFERQNPEIKVEALFCLHIDKKKRTIREYIPVDGVSDAEVDALLQAERDGLFYIDENYIPDASLVLGEEELATYICHADEIAKLKEQIKKIESAMAFCDERILAYMADNNLDEMSAPGGVFKRTAAYTRTTVDSKRLQKVYPAVYNAVTKTTEIAASLKFKPITQ